VDGCAGPFVFDKYAFQRRRFFHEKGHCAGQFTAGLRRGWTVQNDAGPAQFQTVIPHVEQALDAHMQLHIGQRAPGDDGEMHTVTSGELPQQRAGLRRENGLRRGRRDRRQRSVEIRGNKQARPLRDPCGDLVPVIRPMQVLVHFR